MRRGRTGAFSNLTSVRLRPFPTVRPTPPQPPLALGAVIPVWVVLGAALIMLCFYAVGTIGAIIQRSTWKTEQPRWTCGRVH